MKISPLVIAALIPLSNLSPLNAAEPTSPAPATSAPAAEPSAKASSAVPASSLSWDKQKVELDSKFGENVARATYRFTNLGKDPVSLVEITPSCGCVATEVAKLDYAPGESGTIKATIDLEDNDADLQDRTIAVTTSDAPKNPTTLRLIVHVPSPFEATPKAVAWNRGDKPTAQDVVVTAGAGVEDLKLRLESPNGDFSVDLKPEVEGKSYHVSIVPTNTSAMAFAHLRFIAESPTFPKPLRCEIDARVR